MKLSWARIGTIYIQCTNPIKEKESCFDLILMIMPITLIVFYSNIQSTLLFWLLIQIYCLMPFSWLPMHLPSKHSRYFNPTNLKLLTLLVSDVFIVFNLWLSIIIVIFFPNQIFTLNKTLWTRVSDNLSQYEQY